MGVTSTAASAPKLDPPFLRLQPAAPPSSTMATGSLLTDCANAISEQRNNRPNNRKFVALTKWSLAASNFKRAWIFQFKIQWTYKSPTRRNGRRLIACGVHSSRALRANIGHSEWTSSSRSTVRAARRRDPRSKSIVLVAQRGRRLHARGAARRNRGGERRDQQHKGCCGTERHPVRWRHPVEQRSNRGSRFPSSRPTGSMPGKNCCAKVWL